MNRPTVADIRKANKVLEEGDDQDERKPTEKSKKNDWFVWKIIILIFILCSLSNLGGINTFILLGWIGPEKIKEWTKYFFR